MSLFFRERISKIRASLLFFSTCPILFLYGLDFLVDVPLCWLQANFVSSDIEQHRFIVGYVVLPFDTSSYEILCVYLSVEKMVGWNC